MNKLNRGSLDDATYIHIKALGLVASDKKTFICFPIHINYHLLEVRIINIK